jgi:hypothetical protein
MPSLAERRPGAIKDLFLMGGLLVAVAATRGLVAITVFSDAESDLVRGVQLTALYLVSPWSSTPPRKSVARE